MKNIFTVAWFTMKETMRKKSFIISNVLIIAIIFIIFSILEFQLGNYVLFPEEESSTNITENSTMNATVTEEIVATDASSQIVSLVPIVAIVDSQNIFGTYLENLHSEHFKISLMPNATIEELKQLIEDEEIYSAAYVYLEENMPTFDYLVYEYSSSNSDYASYISELLQKAYQKKLLSGFNIPQETIEFSQANINYNIELTKTATEITDASVTIGMVVSFVLFFSIYLFGHNISASIASEKNSRVIETLVTSTSPSHIVVGKTLGMGILGLLQLVVMCIITFVCYKTFIPSGIDFVSVFLADVSINFTTISLLFVYFILGYTLYAFLNAITGATVSKPEDIQIANLPVSFLTMISFYLSFFSITLGTGNKLSGFTSVFPLSSPFFMPSRIIAGLASSSEIGGSIAILVVVTLLLSFISIRIYSVAILHYGNRLKLKDLFNIFLRIK